MIKFVGLMVAVLVPAYAARAQANPSAGLVMTPATFSVLNPSVFGDNAPVVLGANDYGAHWTSIAGNLPATSSVQVIREHPRNGNLLFVGTEHGAFYSADGGRAWTQLKYNIPTVPVHDIVVHPRENDLVIGNPRSWDLHHR